MALVTVENLSFRYALAGRDALNDISLTVEPGEFMLLCGPSGCGKTTLLRHFKQELTPAGERSGRVLYDGAPMGSLPALRSAAEIGLVMQDPDSQIVSDSVQHELAFGLENLGLAGGVIRRRVAEMASFFGISDWFGKKTDELSGGQKQMLNLAAILAMQPKLLLLDEPTAMLDPIAAREFLEMVSRLNRELGITVVMAGHLLDEVFHLTTRVAFLENGRIRCLGAPREVGGYLSENPAALRAMPAPVRVFAAAHGALSDQYPVTVNEGRRFLQSLGLAIRERHPASPAPRRSEPAAECREVSFRYARNAPDVLRTLNLKLYGGEMTCILGENGSGKSTLLRLLSGLLRPVEGRVRLFGTPIEKLNARALYQNGVALLPQNPRALFCCETVGEELSAAANAAGTPESAAEEIARELGLTALTGRHPYDLSGGEMKRVGLAKVLLTRPRLLLLDEPTAGLDAAAKDILAEILHRLCRRGTAVALITHDLDFAAENADRCLLLFDGAAACDGAPREFFGGNCFYTTAAGRMAREIDGGAVTTQDVIELCRNAR